MVIFVPLLVCIVGAIGYFAYADAKQSNFFLQVFWCGLLVTLFTLDKVAAVMR